ncbi:hypothetical protein GCM10027592_58320 [Spirosoma flavus]
MASRSIGLPILFDRFYQVDSGSTRAYSGTGIGLALVKEVAHWLGGRVTVESEEGNGSVFTVELPITSPARYPRNEIDTTLDSKDDNPSTYADQVGQPESALSQSRNAPPHSASRSRQPTEKRTTNPDGEKPFVLLVEDNAELQMQMATYLSKQYRIATAPTGRDGMEQAIAEIPDLIVSDVMMPGMDGFELTLSLKADERTSHIPIVLLMARSSPESRLMGLQAGADHYISKPFNLAELNLRLANALRARQQWQQRFRAQMALSTAVHQAPGEPDREERFLNCLHQYILTNLDEADRMDVGWLAEQAGMSRTQLHRKMTALTSLSPNRFIHRVRLERAAALLQSGEYNVAQVAYELGYSSQSYFAKLFQEHFGYAPSKMKT